MNREDFQAPPDAPLRSNALRRWIQHAFAQGWVCVRSYPSGSGHRAHDLHAKSARRPALEECLAWAAGTDPAAPHGGGNVEVLLQESGLFQVDAEHDAQPPWIDPAVHREACLSRSAGDGLHAVYQCPEGFRLHRWIKPVAGVDLLSKGVWPLPGCRRTGTAKKRAGEWSELAPPALPGPLPQWVIGAIPPTKSRRAKSAAAAAPQSGAWAIKALSGELAAVASATAGDGHAHATMMSSGARLGQIVGAGHLDRESVVEQLVAAGEQAGWPEREARRCAIDAVEFGMKHPRGPAGQLEIEIVNGTGGPSEASAQDESERDESDAEHDERPFRAQLRRLIEFRDGVAWMPDLELVDEARCYPFKPHVEPFSSLSQLAVDVARGLRSAEYETKWLPRHISSIQSLARAKLSERAARLVRIYYEVIRDRVPATDHHLTYTVAAERLAAAHGEDLLWSAVSDARIFHWDGTYWSLDQVALAQRLSDEVAQTFLAERECLERIADRLDREGDQGLELLANLESRFAVEQWRTPPDLTSRAAAQKAKTAALARLQGMSIGEEEEKLFWRVNVAAFLRSRAREVEKLYRRLETPLGVEAVLEKVRYRRQRPEEDFDREPYLLVVKNGVIDLRTGMLIEPDRSKLLTKQARAEYRPGFTHPRWTEALTKWAGSDKLQRWLQVIVGYSLLGLRGSGRYIIIIFGPTRTGKGTFLKVIARALGAYASPFNARAFSDTRHSSHDEDLASLRGVRFAYASEMASARFDAEKLKSASSGDPMRPSRKGEQSFEMVPEAAIWMATNDLPRLSTRDVALWDRLRFVEFCHQFRLSSLGDNLADDPDVRAAVLAWAVEGAVEFIANGLPACDAVEKATEKARGELDLIAEWVEDRVDAGSLTDENAFTATVTLYNDYCQHARADGEQPISKSEFGRLLGQRNVAAAKNDVVRGWRLRLRVRP